jgi:hypothetical protein
MKRVIDGKIFDTNTATVVCELACSCESSSDFSSHTTVLYRTRRGRFFIAGEGGPNSMWARSEGNTREWGEGLRPVSEQEARQYMEDAGCDAEQFLAVGLAVEEA